MNTFTRVFTQAVLITVLANLAALVISATHAEILKMIMASMSHGHYITYALVTACLMNGKRALSAAIIAFILLASLPTPNLMRILFPIAGGMLTAKLILAVSQENNAAIPL
jgi:hypothetical protein